MGYFAISAQTLLFRVFMSSFEGNDIAVAVFFWSWFLWVAVSAWLFDKGAKAAAGLYGGKDPSGISGTAMGTMLLLYIPACILQSLLIAGSRDFAGIAPFSPFPIGSMLVVALVVNLPVSFVTGMIFPTACKWLSARSDIPVSKVYLLEASGSVAGGIATTAMLYLEFNMAMVFILISMLPASAVLLLNLTPNAFPARSRPRAALAFMAAAVLLILVLAAALRLDTGISRGMQSRKWGTLLPEEYFEGAFYTAGREYLFGSMQGRLMIISEGEVSLVIPDKETAATTLATIFAQHHEAREVLVVGDGFNLCSEILASPQVSKLHWFYPDIQFVDKVNMLLPPGSRLKDKRLNVVREDIRRFLGREDPLYDIVVVNIPDSASSHLNRYFTVEFFAQLRQHMSEGAIVAVRVPGGANVFSPELKLIGASVRESLSRIFPVTVVNPGETTWFISSFSTRLTCDPETLSRDFAEFADADEIFPPDGLYSIYSPARSEAAAEAYDSAALPENLLVNRESKPNVYLFQLLLSCRMSGLDALRILKPIMHAGMIPFVAALATALLFWMLYARGAGPSHAAEGENIILVITSGIIAIGSVLVLMFLFQTAYGSLFLHVGLISSLFMCGLAAGAFSARRITLQPRARPNHILCAALVVQMLFFVIVAYFEPASWKLPGFAVAFLVAGFCNGFYFPIAAARLCRFGVPPERSGSMLENADHLGAAIGTCLSGLILIPLLGTSATIVLFSLILGLNLPPALLRILGERQMENAKALNSLGRKTVFALLAAIMTAAVFIAAVWLSGSTGEKEILRKTPDKQADMAEKQPPPVDSTGVQGDISNPGAARHRELQDELPEVQPGSNVRKADIPRIRQMIMDNKLSGHEAEFYREFD